jgi:hypothetical protein
MRQAMSCKVTQIAVAMGQAAIAATAIHNSVDP